MRVNWGSNTISDLTFGPANFRLTAGSTMVQPHEDEAGALDMSENHINVTSRLMVAAVNSASCHMNPWGGVDIYDDNKMDCEPQEVRVRTSFVKVDEEEEAKYEPLPYDDQHYNKFGIFRVNRYAYNRDYGVREPNSQYRANRWHIWERSLDEDGNSIPYRQRTPKPIVYWLNAEFPYDNQGLVDGTIEVERQWDETFRGAAARSGDRHRRRRYANVRDSENPARRTTQEWDVPTRPVVKQVSAQSLAICVTRWSTGSVRVI